MENRKLFECVEILLKTGGLNGCTFTVVLWKRGLKRCEKIDTTKNRQIQKISKLSSKIDVWRSSRAQRLDNYYGLRKTGSRPGTLTGIRTTRLLELFRRKRLSKRRLFGNPENRKWHQNRPVEARSAPGPSKNGPRERFWKNTILYWNFDGKMRDLWGICDPPEPLKLQQAWDENVNSTKFRFPGSVERKSKIDVKREAKSWHFGPPCGHGACGGRLCLPSLTFWCNAKKPCFFERPKIY